MGYWKPSEVSGARGLTALPLKPPGNHKSVKSSERGELWDVDMWHINCLMQFNRKVKVNRNVQVQCRWFSIGACVQGELAKWGERTVGQSAHICLKVPLFQIAGGWITCSTNWSLMYLEQYLR